MDIKKLMEQSVNDRFRWLVEHNRHILIRDKDWEKIYDDIENNADSFGRYYPIMRIRMDNSSITDMCTALMINDDLYEY